MRTHLVIDDFTHGDKPLRFVAHSWSVSGLEHAAMTHLAYPTGTQVKPLGCLLWADIGCGAHGVVNPHTGGEIYAVVKTSSPTSFTLQR